MGRKCEHCSLEVYTVSKEQEATPQKFSKEAFLDASKSTQERLILQIVLQDDVSYTKEDVEKLVGDWKKKPVDDSKKREAKKA
ncbi:hypothetical protein M670_00437 [Schinkia azotoformans MEV2011]|uniref:Uncharacterized protein n=1 Tax=Schinkia azotoformans MEV2011 TaxID=1348973 RepID=A0A072NSE6_SCHAZ|nr:hypothetical protein M670_00437 [Schinkia azotoformans MEV2011]